MKVQYLFSGRRLMWLILLAILATLLLTAATTHAAPVEQSCGSYHRIQRGETMSSISRQYGISIASLMKANPHIGNANRIYAGSTLWIPCHGGVPGGQCSRIHYVQQGQTLSQIAWMYGVSPWSVVRANNLQNPNLIFAGTGLCIP